MYALPNKLKNLEELRSFLESYFKDRNVKVYLLGSRARKDNRVFSDVYLASESKEDLSKEYPLAWTNTPFVDIYPHLGFRD
ncbi:nucleotidyltransferase domain-containing protein [Pampinifervens florentissimum]|uniref:nucleotidyltransferase domain-containing protein n=1 Tax=Pampinifervens florentissimum TaxID=1632019 RepID=UPI0013B486DB|nr:nucleotidyltransferase domain-containing protein [Hydrogenobacter sp. T-8]QID33895.1 nucleotidyltransferase domain-containing protein [Hydrogenobacter sp. T-8]